MDGGSWHSTGGSDQYHPQEKELQKGKIVVWGGLTNSCEKKRGKRQRRKGKIYLFLSDQCKEREENNRMGKTRDLCDHKTGKGQFWIQSQRKVTPKNIQTTAQLHSSLMLTK